MINDELYKELDESKVRTFLIDFIEVKDNDTVFVEAPCAKVISDYLSEKTRKLSFLENGGIKENSSFDKADFIFSIEDPRYKRNLFKGYFSNLFGHLEDSGKLVFSVMNTLGISYISGESEIHTGVGFGGFSEDEKNEEKAALSKNELLEMLKCTGFKNISMFYPVPDSIFPTEIYSDDFLPKEGDIHDVKRNYMEDGMNLMKTDAFINNIIREGLFTNFSNSFLVIAEK